MIQDFATMIEKVSGFDKSSISVAAAHDKEVLEAVVLASRASGIRPVLFGDASRISNLLDEIGFTGAYEVINEPDDAACARASVKYVHDDRAQVLMKGLVNTSSLMRAVLDKDIGLRTGRILSHLAAFELPGFSRLIYVTDGGVNIEPDFEDKKEILMNALLALKKIGYECPRVAVLAANELVNKKATATVDAARIASAWEEGEFGPDCVVEGPIALDVALSRDAAKHKHLRSSVAGKTDILLAPTIEVGNVLGKCMTHLANAKMAGVVLGAKVPIVLASRSETAQNKMYSIFFSACCA
ncbi:MAG: phosphate butyryltransferase [Synergistaceae bacterium]|jgi:phosphate butyryltransferase|nr:phosphate butyryltransferase [Synergistaceae bacterium]